MNQVQVLETPIKSEGDKKDYRLIKLPNGLKALLIRYNEESSSESEDIAAIKLAIKVGSFDDPANAMGLAHFLEHIVFMGSKKYPGENSFNEFLEANGGSDNAMTSAEYTAFYFKVSEKAFAEAIDIFAHQFISPLLLKNVMQREREAVDSEFQMAKSNDYILIENINKSLISENHPASQFDCGNLKTLKEEISDDDLHSELLKFFGKYVGSKMCLAMQSKRPLDEMQELVVASFSAIKSESDTEVLQTKPVEEIFKPEFFNNMIYMKPKTATKSLRLTWVFPSMQKDYKCSPFGYVSKIFGNDGVGGIQKYLQEKQLITQLSFHNQSNSFSGNSQFCMPKLAITLTDSGAANIDKILDAIFSYLIMLKETPIEEHSRLYNEFKEQRELVFKFHRESTALSNVQQAAPNMLIYDDIDIVRGGNLFQTFNEHLIVDTIDKLNQRKFNLLILNNEHESFGKKEKYFGAEYDEIEFPEEYQKLWDERKANSEFYLEKPNPFKATNFEVFVDETESPKYPVKVLEDEILEVWHKLDNKFLQPRVSVAVQFLSPKQTTSIQNFLYMMIYDYMLTQYLRKTYSQASSAGLNVYSGSEKKSFTLTFGGYNDKMTEFIEMVSQGIKTYNENLEQSLFDTIKTQSKKRYFNSLLSSDDLNDEFFKEILNNDFYHDYELYKEIDSITFENLQKFIPKFFRMMKIKVLVQGNATKNQALEIGNILKGNFACEPLDDAEYELKTRCYQMPLGTSVFRARSLMLNDDNSYLQNYYQIGLNNLRNRNLTQLVVSFLHPKCFDYLRNKEQLGYSVGCAFNETKGVLGITVHVSSQEHKHLHTKVLQKMDIFMNKIAKSAIQNISDEEFESFKQSRVKMLLADHVTLSNEMQRNWSEIKDHDYIFNRAELSAKVTQSLTKENLQQFFESFTKPENMRRLSVQVIGTSQVNDISQENDSERVLKVEFMTEKLTEDENLIGEDIKEFQKDKHLHPVEKFEIE